MGLFKKGDWSNAQIAAMAQVHDKPLPQDLTLGSWEMGYEELWIFLDRISKKYHLHIKIPMLTRGIHYGYITHATKNKLLKLWPGLEPKNKRKPYFFKQLWDS